MFSQNHYHNHNVEVKEFKAPTDDSIRILNEMQEKVIDNIISKIEVKDNLVEGHIYIIDMLRTTANGDLKVICKFKINGNDFVVEKNFNRCDLSDAKMIHLLNQQAIDFGKSTMLWFALKQFALVAHKQIMGTEPPEFLLRQFVSK